MLSVNSNHYLISESINTASVSQKWVIECDSTAIRQFKSEVYYKSLDITSPLRDLQTLNVTSDFGPRSTSTSSHFGVDITSIIPGNTTYGYMLYSTCYGTVFRMDDGIYSGYYIYIQCNHMYSFSDINETPKQLYFYFCHLYGTDSEYQNLEPLDNVTPTTELGHTYKSDGFDNTLYAIHLHMAVTTVGASYSTDINDYIDPLLFYDYLDYN